jgi:hypothetical protein
MIGGINVCYDAAAQKQYGTIHYKVNKQESPFGEMG